ncbi:MAG TPA: hypothetical protein VD997_12190 [Phycisphaerales bacterium]|nr:hypothetical protein [Phycisphaerales bacterium]
MLLYLAADLIWGTKIKATAQAVGVTARPVRNLEMLEARLADQPPEDPVRAVLLDLEVPEVALSMLARLKGAAHGGTGVPTGASSVSGGTGLPTGVPIRVLCWAPHVERDLMDQARSAGADAVMTRGAFDARMELILKEWDGK